MATPIDPPVAGDHAVAEDLLTVEPEVGASVGDEAIQLDEAAFVKKEVEPFAGGELALFMLLRDTGRTPAPLGFGLEALQVFQQLPWFGHVDQ